MLFNFTFQMTKYEPVARLCYHEISQVTPPSMELENSIEMLRALMPIGKTRWVLYSFLPKEHKQKDGSTKGKVLAFATRYYQVQLRIGIKLDLGQQH